MVPTKSMCGPTRWFFPLSILLAAVALWHFGRLDSPPVQADEVPFADFALHGELSLWNEILTPALQPLRNTYGLGFIPGDIGLLRCVFRVAGVGVEQGRFLSVLAGLLGLGLLVVLAQQLELPLLAPLGLVLFSLTHVFFSATHCLRPEGIIFFLITLNVLWAIYSRSPWTGFCMGLLLGLGAMVYPTVLFGMLAVWLYGWRKNDGVWRLDSRWIRWMTGVAIGLLGSIGFIDWRQGGSYLRLVHGKNVQWPLMLRFILNPSQGIDRALSMISNFAMNNTLFPFFLSSLALSTVLCVRRWNVLESAERQILRMAALLMISYAALSPSSHPNYSIFLLPWFWMILGLSVDHLFHDTWTFDATDLAGMGFILVALFTSDVPFGARLVSFTTSLLLLGYSWRSIGKRMQVGILLGILFLFILKWDGIWALTVMISSVWSYRLKIILFALFGPLLLTYVRFRWRRRPLAFSSKAVGVALVVLLGSYWINEFKLVGRLIVPKARIETFRDSLKKLHGERIVAPMEYWLYDPALQMQAIQALFPDGQTSTPEATMAALYHYAPSYIIMDPQWKERLLAKNSAASGCRWQNWETPAGHDVGTELENCQLQLIP